MDGYGRIWTDLWGSSRETLAVQLPRRTRKRNMVTVVVVWDSRAKVWKGF
jgi:hypothetical protein